MENEKSNRPLEASAAEAKTHGTPEVASLTVKKLTNEWIVENGVGEAIATEADRKSAINAARRLARNLQASGIAVQNEDGSPTESLPV